MNVELKLSDAADAYVLKNMYPLYLHDISEFEPLGPNRHGLVSHNEELVDLAAQGEAENAWWRSPASLFPYIILAEGRPAGFNLIAKPPYLPEGLEAEIVIYGFFLLHAYRGRGVGEPAAVQGFDLHRGRWEVVTYPPHERAIGFWRRVIGNYTSGTHSENEVDHPWGRKVAFTFGNHA